MMIKPQVPGYLRVQTWNVQGMGEVSCGMVAGSELLSNFEELGKYDFL